jgi:hypothetical protein
MQWHVTFTVSATVDSPNEVEAVTFARDLIAIPEHMTINEVHAHIAPTRPSGFPAQGGHEH